MSAFESIGADDGLSAAIEAGDEEWSVGDYPRIALRTDNSLSNGDRLISVLECYRVDFSGSGRSEPSRITRNHPSLVAFL